VAAFLDAIPIRVPDLFKLHEHIAISDFELHSFFRTTLQGNDHILDLLTVFASHMPL
jgi:hypothetical protein